MRKNHTRYLEFLRSRHEKDRAEVRAALAGRRPGALKAIERRQRAVEEETARILESVSGRKS